MEVLFIEKILMYMTILFILIFIGLIIYLFTKKNWIDPRSINLDWEKI